MRSGDQRSETKLLLRRGAGITLSGHGNAWQIALRRGSYDLAVTLCRAGKWRPAPSVAESRALDAVEHGHLATFRTALRRVRGPLLDRAGRPAFLRVAQLGCIDFARWMLAQGQLVEQPDPIGFTALMEASREGHVELVRELLDQGAYANTRRPFRADLRA